MLIFLWIPLLSIGLVSMNNKTRSSIQPHQTQDYVYYKYCWFLILSQHVRYPWMQQLIRITKVSLKQWTCDFTKICSLCHISNIEAQRSWALNSFYREFFWWFSCFSFKILFGGEVVLISFLLWSLLNNDHYLGTSYLLNGLFWSPWLALVMKLWLVYSIFWR